jgi:hypothetical protein
MAVKDRYRQDRDRKSKIANGSGVERVRTSVVVHERVTRLRIECRKRHHK